MRLFTIVLCLGLFVYPSIMAGQSLYSRLKCEITQEVTGSVASMEVHVNPARMDHRKRKAYYQFDSRGRLIEREMKGEKWTFEYDSSGRVVESRRYFKEYLQEIRKKQYRGNRVLEAVYEPDGTTLVRSIFMKLDESQRPVEMEIRFPGQEKKVVQSARFKKDKVEIVKTSADGYENIEIHYCSSGCIDDVLKKSSNVKGQLLRELVKRKTNTGTVFLEHIYQYDEMGNWTTQKTFRYNKTKRTLLQEITRVIEYNQI